MLAPLPINATITLLKYGIAAYHGVSMDAVNTALERNKNAPVFPSKDDFTRLGEERIENYNYVNGVYTYAKSH